jgi:hypothetical protein
MNLEKITFWILIVTIIALVIFSVGSYIVYNFDGFGFHVSGYRFKLYEDHSWGWGHIDSDVWITTGCLPFGLCQD